MAVQGYYQVIAKGQDHVLPVMTTAARKPHADSGIQGIKEAAVLNVIPVPQRGTPVELSHAFYSKRSRAHPEAIRNRETQLYRPG